MTLRRATPADFGFIRGVAGRPENARFILDEDEAALSRHLDSPESALLIGEDAGRPVGFALFCQVGNPSGRVELRRLALDAPGRGGGRAFLRELTAYGFEPLGASRIWLDVAGDNDRAQALYRALGYIHEGTLRRHWRRPAGDVVDLMLFGMLREEWAG